MRLIFALSVNYHDCEGQRVRVWRHMETVGVDRGVTAGEYRIKREREREGEAGTRLDRNHVPQHLFTYSEQGKLPFTAGP